MAKFKFEKIQLGYEGKEITTVMALERIEFESGERVSYLRRTAALSAFSGLAL